MKAAVSFLSLSYSFSQLFALKILKRITRFSCRKTAGRIWSGGFISVSGCRKTILQKKDNRAKSSGGAKAPLEID